MYLSFSALYSLHIITSIITTSSTTLIDCNLSLELKQPRGITHVQPASCSSSAAHRTANADTRSSSSNAAQPTTTTTANGGSRTAAGAGQGHQLVNKAEWLNLRVHGGAKSWYRLSNCFKWERAERNRDIDAMVVHSIYILSNYFKWTPRDRRVWYVITWV